MSKLRIGIIGCGRISIRHFLSIKAIEEVELVACCDVKKERADEAAENYGIKAYYSYEEMMASEQLDAVHLCLPHYLHSKVAIYAMERGINVLTEKPMDVDYESAAKAVDVAKEKNLKFGVIFQCRYNNPAQLVKKAVTSGKLGKILSARSILTWNRSDDYYNSSDWKGTWDKEGGGVVIDQAIHSIDLVNWIVDSEIESVSCSMHNRGHKIVDVEDSAEGFITYKNGVKYNCTNEIKKYERRRRKIQMNILRWRRKSKKKFKFKTILLFSSRKIKPFQLTSTKLVLLPFSSTIVENKPSLL